jgi:hypothetical protein
MRRLFRRALTFPVTEIRHGFSTIPALDGVGRLGGVCKRSFADAMDSRGRDYVAPSDFRGQSRRGG